MESLFLSCLIVYGIVISELFIAKYIVLTGKYQQNLCRLLYDE